MNYSLTIITPLAWVDAANALCVSLGWGRDNFLVPLSPDGTSPVTHFGLRATVTTDFVTALEDALGGLPDLAGALTIDIRDDPERLGQFDAVIVQQGLSRIEPAVGV